MTTPSSSSPFNQPPPAIRPASLFEQPSADPAKVARAADGPKPPMTLPPSLWGSTPREPLRESVRQARWMLISFWVLLLNGYLAFIAVVAAYGHPFAAVELGLEWVLPSLIGTVLGHVVAMLRVRSWPVWLVAIGLCILAPMSLFMVPPVLLGAISLVLSFAFGHLAMQRRGALFATFMPISFWTGAIVTLLQHEGRLEVWEQGDKGSIWQPVPLMLLFLAVTEVFLFFAGQEHYHATAWQTHTGHETALRRHAGAGPRLTGRGIFAIVAFAGLVFAAVALLSPYLWRTEQHQGNGQGQGSGQQRGSGQGQDSQNGNGSDRNGSGQGNGSGGDSGDGQAGRGNGDGGEGEGSGGGGTEFDPDAVGRSLERAKREAERSASYLFPLIPLFLLTRPLRRAFLLRHLRRPLWRVNPSRRARNLWRFVLIALGDAGVKRAVSDSIDDEVRSINARRAQGGLAAADGLGDAARQYQRMRFGLGIPPGALDEMRGHAERAFASVRAPLDGWIRFKNWWRKIEV